MFTTTTVTVTPGVELEYVDTGAPSKSPYTTLFIVHGMCFHSPIFEKVQAVAFARGIRVVAITRRNFPGSTPYTPEEIAIVKEGTPQAKDAWMAALGLQIATLVAGVIKKENLPPLSADRKTGGVALLGWSLGVIFSIATIASADGLPTEDRDRFAQNLHTLIIYEPAPIAIGLPTPANNWIPLMDQSLPEDHRFNIFAQWITSYFDHSPAAFEARDAEALNYWTPSTFRPPSIFTGISSELSARSLSLNDRAFFDMHFLMGMQDQLKATHRKALFDKAHRALFSRLKVTHFAGIRGPAWGPAGVWALQDAEKEAGAEGSVIYKFVPDANHFMHCDEPERFVDICQEYMAQ